MQALLTVSDRRLRILLCGPPAVRSSQLDYHVGCGLMIRCYLQLREQPLTTDVQRRNASEKISTCPNRRSSVPNSDNGFLIFCLAENIVRTVQEALNRTH